MDRLSAMAASGIRTRMESLDLLANNIANASTSGFKADREFYNLYTSAEALEDGADVPASHPVVEKHWTDFAQGALTPTANPLDVALSGSGFFGIQGTSGPVYTRNGNFRIGTTGQLETTDGYAVRGQNGKPIVLNSSKSVTITADGSVIQDATAVGRLEIVNFQSPDHLTKLGNTYFQMNDVSAVAKAATGAKVQQGILESSNGAPAEQAVRLVSVMRQFEMLQRAVSIGTDMNKKAIDEVARVNG